jgi:hypothetical protein
VLLLSALLSAACTALPAGGAQGGPAAAPGGLFEALIDLYGDVVAEADGNRCPMVPSCSAYGREAFHRHGPLLGWVLTCDRLARCGHDEVRLAPALRDRNGVRSHDPLAANDFWWRGSPPASAPPRAATRGFMPRRATP